MTGRRRKPGRMGPFIEGYRDWLAGRGYASATVINMLAMAGDLGRWMGAHDVAPIDLDREVIAEFRDAMRAAGRRSVPGVRGLDPLLDYLEHVGVLVRPSDGGNAGRGAGGALPHLVGCRSWHGRGHRLEICEAGTDVPGASGRCAGGLTGADIVAFLLAEGQRLSVGSVKGPVAELRSLLRFLYLQGLTPRSLASVVPPVAGWRDTGVPKAIPAEDVQRLLDSCDRSDPSGIRDYAILMLVARLGLGSAEVARLQLDDIDWLRRTDRAARQGVPPGRDAAAV